ncbi:MAG: XdhC/CoxI family protein [Candidatus Tenebribacter burtonii]|jgi:xanthine dehydrogenase accessory factor|nr:XdhC/CoxI family protein [Candidatus Tenebribacter burtonii]
METAVFNVLQKAVENQKNGIAFVLATVVEGVEKTPGRSGFKLISYEDKTSEGTVGGGKLERMVLDKCEEIHITKQNAFLEFELTETSEGIGMMCGGNAKIYLEYFPPTKKVYIFGAGHLCRSIVPILNSIGFYCIVVDIREEYANKERIPLAKEIFATDYFEFLEQFEPQESDSIVIFTHGHTYDFDILDKLCKKNVHVKYIGMIGSKIKAADAINRIKKQNYSGNLIDSVYAPIGLNIGKTTTQEIAIAVTAEMLAVYNNVSQVSSLCRKLK